MATATGANCSARFRAAATRCRIRSALWLRIPAGVGPKFPQVVVLFGATGDLARRKLLPGLYHLATSGFMPGCRIIGVSLDAIDADAVPRSSRARRWMRP